jgi:hypothetical protein
MTTSIRALTDPQGGVSITLTMSRRDWLVYELLTAIDHEAIDGKAPAESKATRKPRKPRKARTAIKRMVAKAGKRAPLVKAKRHKRSAAANKKMIETRTRNKLAAQQPNGSIPTAERELVSVSS